MLTAIFLYLSLLLFAPTLTCAQRSADALSEIKALTAFKLNLHDPLGALDGWNSSTPSAPCDWRGILCYNGRVWELRLPRLQLGGRLTDQLSNLRQLRKLSLHSNAFNGSVPLSLSQCSLLRAVYLHYNSFSGGLPPALTNLTNLQVLNVAHNFLSGGIPGNLPRNLRYLDLSSNAFSGNIPANFSVASSLQLINLSFNQFSGGVPASIGELQQLQYLWLDSNQLYGTIPSAISNLSTLRILDLSGNFFSGVLPIEIGNLLRLEELRVANNSLQGEVPREIQKCSLLQVLDLEGNRFSGQLPPFLGALTSLKTLSLGRNHFSGSIPASFRNLSQLEVLNLSENNLIGDVLEELLLLSNLSILNLSFNKFYGEVPATFGFLQSLVVLSLSQNHVSSVIPSELGNCSDLEALELRSNRLSGEIPGELSRLSHLKELDLGQNNLTGEIPEDISNGVIPVNFSGISTLKYLNLSQNNLEGEIPKMLGSQFTDPSVFAMNPKLCGKPLKEECEGVTKRKRRKLILLVCVAVGGATLLALCCCGYIFSLLRWRKKLREGAAGEKKRSPAPSSGGERGRGSGENGGPKLVMFNNKITYAETLEATRQFDEENVLSRGRYGLVFKASFQDGMVLSIRRLPDGSIEENTFRKEAESLGKVKHRNLTVLRGYYAGPPDVRLLVYDYMPNGNLATLLQEASHQDGHVLNWPMRHLIALGIARGLSFLHSVSMVHGDVKPQNVLFDADFEAHLSDFGLDRLTIPTPAEPSSSTTPIGSLGYVSPEAALTGEADVYSFGIVLLEILTGRKPVMFTQDEDIVKWVKKQLQRGQISELLEPGLLEIDPESSEWEEFLLGVKVGLLCTAPDPLDRPSMSDIVFMLEGCRVGPDIPSSADPTSLPSPVSGGKFNRS
ncbi:unnamed protein product, partial [Vitis vinifera]